MSFDNAVTLISSVGFPIFTAGALGWYIYKVQDKQTEALSSLTEAVNRLLDKLEKEGD